MSKINLKFNIGDKFDKAQSYIDIKLGVGKESYINLDEKVKKSNLNIQNKMMIDIQCKYSEQDKLFEEFKKSKIFNLLIQKYKLSFDYNRDTEHIQHLFIFNQKFIDEDYKKLIVEMLQPLGVLNLLKQYNNQFNIKLEMNQDMEQTIIQLNKTDSFGLTFLKQIRAQIEVNINPNLFLSSVDLVNKLGFDMPEFEFFSTIFSKFSDIDFETSFESADKLPQDLKNYLFRLPAAIFKRGKHRVMNDIPIEFNAIEKLIGDTIKIYICIIDLGSLEIEMKGPKMFYFLKNFLGILEK